ncbi:MAG TPA: 30S ribosomal protein S7 [Candidatus Saccharimonadia bacterium]|nr:30S ribosomal protein S7 [Gammaproteobacteria bacterium]HZZ98584.1 30S ribosomal protein S7 [Candidatus Saccharimonadia bacterium]
MPRRKAAIKREMLPDPLYGSERLARFINVVMREGKRSVAERIVYTALDEVSRRLKKSKHAGAQGKKTDEEEGSSGSDASSTGAGKSQAVFNKEVLEIFDKALNNIRPTVEVKSRRVGGATYQVPVEVDTDRGIALAMRWIVKASKERGEKTMILRLAAEMLDAHEGRGASVKVRDDMHRMAKANQAFAHYRW